MGYEPFRPDNRNDVRDSDPGRSPARSYGYGYDPDRDRYRSSARDYVAAGYDEDGQERGRSRGWRDGYGTNERQDWRGQERAPHGRSAQGHYGEGYRNQTRRPDGYDYDERGFFDRAGDEVRSWFGDEEAERRRAMDARYDESHGSGWGARDDDYHGWRRRQIDDLDRDYHEYRRENATRFEIEFGAWRTERQGQRSALSRVAEHMEVVGSDGSHIGTVDKVRGDRIVLTKSDSDAGGHHHSIPSRWIDSVDDKVTVRKTADEAKAAWRDEDRTGALFGGQDWRGRDSSGW